MFKWPEHLLKLYHETQKSQLGLPFILGTKGFPDNDHSLIHRYIKSYVLTASDRQEFRKTFCSAMEAITNFDKSTLKSLMSPELFECVSARLTELIQTGYRIHLKNRWEQSFDTKIYSYINLSGISPLSVQNFPLESYKIHQVNAFHFPLRIEFLPNEEELQDLEDSKEIAIARNPFYIRDLPPNSRHLHNMLKKFPINVCVVDVGILSQLKIHLIDLYSQSKTVEGDDPDEYEFHLLRFQRIYPSDLDRYSENNDYKRFIDANFSHEYFNWTLIDIDQFMQAFPVS